MNKQQAMSYHNWFGKEELPWLPPPLKRFWRRQTLPLWYRHSSISSDFWRRMRRYLRGHVSSDLRPFRAGVRGLLMRIFFFWAWLTSSVMRITLFRFPHTSPPRPPAECRSRRFEESQETVLWLLLHKAWVREPLKSLFIIVFSFFPFKRFFPVMSVLKLVLLVEKAVKGKYCEQNNADAYLHTAAHQYTQR